MNPPNELPDALIREISGEGRWSQFSVVRENVLEYFGTQPDVPYTITLRHVTATGRLEGEEHPAWIIKGSVNWAFELRAATNLDYPGTDHRPIVILLRTGGGLNTGSGSFLYMLLMPGEPGHDLMSNYLATNFHGPAGQLKWVVRTANEFKAIWADSPLWKHWP
jgi:hypothetical protein